MAKKEWPEDGYPDEPIEIDGIVFEDRQGLSADVLDMLMAVEEPGRTEQLDVRRVRAIEWIKLLRKVQRHISFNRDHLRAILAEPPMPLVVLQTEFAIKDAQHLITKTMQFLANNSYLRGDGKPFFNELSIASAKLTSDLTYHGLVRIANDAGGVKEISVGKEQLELPPVGERAAKIAESALVPPKIVKKELPQLMQDIEKGLARYAGVNHILTFHDIHGFIDLLHSLSQFFDSALTDMRFAKSTIEAMRDAGVDEESLAESLKGYNFKQKMLEFRAMYSKLSRLLKLTLWRMESVNLPANQVLAEEYDRGLIRDIVLQSIITPMRHNLEVLAHPDHVSLLEELLKRAYADRES